MKRSVEVRCGVRNERYVLTCKKAGHWPAIDDGRAF